MRCALQANEIYRCYYVTLAEQTFQTIFKLMRCHSTAVKEKFAVGNGCEYNNKQNDSERRRKSDFETSIKQNVDIVLYCIAKELN